jgi:TonB family protein
MGFCYLTGVNMKRKPFQNVTISMAVIAALCTAGTGSAAAAASTQQSGTVAAGTTLERDAAACPPPAYPYAAVKNGEEGEVTLTYIVAKNGKIVNVEPVGESATGALKRASFRALQKCQLPPAASDSARQTIRHSYGVVFG